MTSLVIPDALHTHVSEGSSPKINLPTKTWRFPGRTLCHIRRARMASGFDTRVSSNSSPTGISKGAGALGRGVTFTVTYAGC